MSASRGRTSRRTPGKSLHEGFPDSDRRTYLDFNRSGVPLIEIVTEPDLRSAAEAGEFFSRLREILVASASTTATWRKGSLRCDANVSVRPVGTSAFGVKTEVKNLNSFRHVQRALEYEIERQTEIVAERTDGSSRKPGLWDSAAGRTVSMRSKEEAHDYRYFPEPDLAAARDRVRLGSKRSGSSCLSCQTRAVAVSSRMYALPDYDAGVLTQSPALADYFEATAALAGNPKAASNWVMGELTRKMNELCNRHRLGRVDAGGACGLDSARRLGHDQRARSPRTCSRRCTRPAAPRTRSSAAEGLARIDDAGRDREHISRM